MQNPYLPCPNINIVFTNPLSYYPDMIGGWFMDNQIIVIAKGIILYNGKVLTIKRSDYDKIGPGNWEFVSGKIKFSESLEETLIREVME